MTVFLTSNPLASGGGTLSGANGFREELECALPRRERMLFICSDPDNHPRTDYYAAVLRDRLTEAELGFETMSVLDGRDPERAEELVTAADLIVLAGGHVPTQNAFFQRIGLKDLLRDREGTILGISAGTMNAARTVYAHPERPGEATDPAYRRFLSGLGLTEIMVLPHLADLREETLDRLRVLEDIAFPDSAGRSFLALPDGSYLLLRAGETELRGEAWKIAEGAMERISEEGERRKL